jgi:hypothetical protein
MADIHDHVNIEQALKQLGIIPDDGDVPPIIIGEANDGANVGAGEGRIYRDKTGVTLNFRTLQQGAGIVIATDDENDVVSIAATGTGAGDVEGTPPSRTNDFAIYFDATGLKIKDSSLRQFQDSNELYMEGEDPNSPTTWLRLVGLEYTAPNGIPSGTKVVVGNTSEPIVLRSSGDHYVNTSGKRAITETISTPWTIPQRGIVTHADGDVWPALTLGNTGSQPGESKIHVGNRDPEGNVTANQGSLYIRKDGDSNSTVYFKASGVGNTGWINLVGAFVTGPVSATDEAIAIYNGTSGKVIKNSPFRIQDVSNIHRLQVDDPNAPTTWLDAIRADYIEPNGQPSGTRIIVGNTSRKLVLESASEIYSAATGNKKVITESISSDWAVPKPGSITQDTADTTRILELINSGTNPGNSKIYAGNRSPEGNVTADQGSLYIRDDGANSTLYVKESGASNTGWSDLINPDVGFTGYRASGTQTITTLTEVKVEFPNKINDPGGDFNTTTYVFTAPTTGAYSFSASGRVTMPSKGRADFRLYHNTGMIAEGGASAGSAETLRPHVSVARVQMTAGQTMEVRAYNSSNGSATIQNTGLNFSGVQLRRGP